MTGTPRDPRFTDPAPRINGTARLKGCRIGRYCEIGERVILRDVTVGDFSYFERHGEAIYTDIGRFCSIAANVRINALEHPLERPTTHKISYRPNEYFRYLGVDQGFREKRMQKRVTIGHDVWIGHGAVIVPGITLGHGSVVGANAVVTHSVEPYAIVTGVPARQMRRRFDGATVARLLDLAWWDWSEEHLFEAVTDMQEIAIDAFLDKWENFKGR